MENKCPISMPDGRVIEFDLQRLSRVLKPESSDHDSLRILVGPVEGSYFAAVMIGECCVHVHGPAANAASARFEAERWVFLNLPAAAVSGGELDDCA